MEKTKMMVFKKGEYRKEEEEIEWKGKKIERVKKFNYLGYTMKENNKEEEHIKNMTAKANRVVGKVWGKVERWFKNDWKRRMILFDALIKSILMYGVEIWATRSTRA